MGIKYTILENEGKVNGTILSEATKQIFETEKPREKEYDFSKLIIPPDLFKKQDLRE